MVTFFQPQYKITFLKLSCRVIRKCSHRKEGEKRKLSLDEYCKDCINVGWMLCRLQMLTMFRRPIR